jgi:FkbM family methyltransferase
MRFILYPWDRPYVRNLVWSANEEAQYKAMSLLIRPGDVVFDVGAHVGRYSVFVSSLVGPKGIVYAFEPVPDTYWMLRETLALNRCENVVAIEKAMCDKVEAVMMNLFESQYSAWNTMGQPLMTTPDGKRVAPSKSIAVPSDTIDHFCTTQGIDRINFLKVDVEGFDKLVFLGAEHFLKERRVDYICFEVSQDPLKGAGIRAKEMFDVLEKHGYFVYQFHEGNRTFQGPIHDSSEYWANYFASFRDLSAY